MTYMDGQHDSRALCVPVAAISSEWWGSGAEPPAGFMGRPPGQGSEGHSPPEAEKKSNFDNTKPL